MTRGAFNGVAWRELRGKLTEDSIKNGLRNGRCVQIYANARLAEEGVYKNGEPVGQLKKWYESGKLASLREYDEDSRTIYEREYNSAGVLIKEAISKPRWRLRFWTDQGALIYASENNASHYFSANGICVITKDDSARSETSFDDQELFDQAFTMLLTHLNLVHQVIFEWLHKKLDEGNADAKSLLRSLLNHPVVGVVETALFNVEGRNYLEAMPLVRDLVLSHKKKKKNEGGYIGTTSELAERVLRKLTRSADPVARQEIQAFLDIAAEKRQQHGKRRKLQEEKRLRIKQDWPKAEALFKQTFIAESTIKSGDQLFSDDVMMRQVQYVHVYAYVIHDKTYRATHACAASSPTDRKMLRYRGKKPYEYVFCE